MGTGEPAGMLLLALREAEALAGAGWGGDASTTGGGKKVLDREDERRKGVRRGF